MADPSPPPASAQRPTHRSSVRLGRLAGVPIGVQPLWLVIVGFITYALGHDYFPQEAPGISDTAAYALGLVSALLLFAGIVAHELGHAVVARRRGVGVAEIDLWLLGGVARLHGEPREPGDELRYAAAGPAVTLGILAVLALVRVAVGGVLADWALALLDYQLYVTAAILVFNLLPAFPLDGGRILRALLWRRSGDRDAATDRAAGAGRAFGWAFVALGVLSAAGGAVNGLWLAFIGGFLILAGAAEAQSTRTQSAFRGLAARDVMTPDPATLGAALTLEDAVSAGFAHHLFTAFPVVGDDGRPLGLLTIAAVRAVDPAARRGLRVTDAMVADPALVVGLDEPVADLLARSAFLRVGRAVVVDGDGRLAGLVSVTDLERSRRADELLGGHGS
jgi:Zn-dependent protease/CBS domain-containing protein